MLHIMQPLKMNKRDLMLHEKVWTTSKIQKLLCKLNCKFTYDTEHLRNSEIGLLVK